MPPFRICRHPAEQLFRASDQRMFSVVVPVHKRKRIPCIFRSVYFAAYQIVLIQFRIYPAGIFILPKAADAGIKVWHALHFDERIIILHVIRKPACDVQYIHFCRRAVSGIIKRGICNVFQFNRVFRHCDILCIKQLACKCIGLVIQRIRVSVIVRSHSNNIVLLYGKRRRYLIFSGRNCLTHKDGAVFLRDLYYGILKRAVFVRKFEPDFQFILRCPVPGKLIDCRRIFQDFHGCFTADSDSCPVRKYSL